ncbi:MAG: hypothetical protein DMD67_12980 [Gemmatimonadetes bacterium]|nr:MAG: hypothetical protein DMD67_12980 [Gemmatimonadota bacterium]
MLRGVPAPLDFPSLELQCFGAPTARLDGTPAPAKVLWRKHLALLTYLALSPGRTRSREHLLGLLWPEKKESYARHSLNQAVAILRGLPTWMPSGSMHSWIGNPLRPRSSCVASSSRALR